MKVIKLLGYRTVLMVVADFATLSNRPVWTWWGREEFCPGIELRFVQGQSVTCVSVSGSYEAVRCRIILHVMLSQLTLFNGHVSSCLF
jgi:hypothetical protein